VNQHHDAFHPGMLSGGNGTLLWPIAAIVMVEPAEAAQVMRGCKSQDVVMSGIAEVTEGEKQRCLLKEIPYASGKHPKMRKPGTIRLHIN
jgi:hypothetical protein